MLGNCATEPKGRKYACIRMMPDSHRLEVNGSVAAAAVTGWCPCGGYRSMGGPRSSWPGVATGRTGQHWAHDVPGRKYGVTSEAFAPSDRKSDGYRSAAGDGDKEQISGRRGLCQELRNGVLSGTRRRGEKSKAVGSPGPVARLALGARSRIRRAVDYGGERMMALTGSRGCERME